jgi:hypothetical protein
MGTGDSVDDIKAKLAEAEEFLEGLRSGNLHIGNPSEGRSEAKMADLQRQIEMYRLILERLPPTGS